MGCGFKNLSGVGALMALAMGLATLAPAALARAAVDVELDAAIESSQILLTELDSGASLKPSEKPTGAAPRMAKAAPAEKDPILGDEFWLLLAALTGLGFALRRRSAL